MPLPIRKSLIMVAMVLYAGFMLSVAQQKKPSTQAKKAEPAESPKAIAVHEFTGEDAQGVDLALMEVTRTAPDVVIVKWEYRNKTAKAQQLASGSKGWSDPYRLSINTYLLDEDTKTKIPVSRDDKRVPVAGGHGVPNQLVITVPGNKVLKTWAKYITPASTKKVTVVIVGAEPFEDVEVKEPATKSGS